MNYVKNLSFKLLIFFLLILINKNLFALDISFKGMSKLNLADIQSITTSDIYDKNISINEVNEIIKDLYNSDLIYDLNLIVKDQEYIIEIIEANLVSNIYINGNEWIEDDLILDSIFSKPGSLISKDLLQKDIETIRKIYSSKGFSNSGISLSIEKYSPNSINIIFDIYEGNRYKISYIDFKGNYFFSDRFLSSLIESREINFYNFFKSGSNLNFEIFNYDKNKIINLYKDYGFFDISVESSIDQLSLDTNKLTFFIKEGERLKIDTFNFNFNKIFQNQFVKNKSINFEKKIGKNNFYYDFDLINDYLEELNNYAVLNNHGKYIFDYEININEGKYTVNFFNSQIEEITINKIDIVGNSITKDSTLRSKITIEPGDYINKKNLDIINKKISSFPYINNSEYKIIPNSDNNADINFLVEENNKTGNILLAGALNADTGFGVNFGIEDKNIFGSGNSLKSNFNFNAEDINFNINYIQYPLFNSNITNYFSIFNDERDYSSSFGYKTTNSGFGYAINYYIDKNSSFGGGISYENIKGHSAKNNNILAITDSIGNFDNLVFKINYKFDTTDDLFNPTNGYKNNINLTISPKDISNDNFYKITLSNKNYFKSRGSNNFIFFLNNYGLANSFDARLKTINSFSLGGLNFKGFDYRGIGPKSNNIYLGGNQYFTSTLGYGGSFLFDEKDNVNIKLFTTVGSIWDSDYSTDNNFDLRSSIGTSLDFLTPIGPISFSYSIPIDKKDSDTSRNFSFSIGSSF